MSVQRCRQETTSSEFVMWLEHRERQINRFHREDYFWANIAKIITQANCNDPKKVELDEFLLKFKVDTGEKEDKQPPTEEEMHQRMLKSKATWASILGANPNVSTNNRNLSSKAND